MASCFTEEATEFSEALLNRLSNLTDTALVPALWLYEVVNVAENGGSQRAHFEREGERMSDDKVEDFVSYLTTVFGPNSPKPQSPADIPE